MSDDLAYTPATELVAAYRDKRLSPVEATQAALDRIEAHNETLNAYCLIDAECALAARAGPRVDQRIHMDELHTRRVPNENAALPAPCAGRFEHEPPDPC